MKTLLVASILAFSASQGFAMDSLSDLTWKNRVVIVFGQIDDRKLVEQIEVLKRQRKALAERDMVVIRVSGGEARVVYGDAPDRNAAGLRKEAEVAGEGFQVVLVGKDGGVKLRSEKVVSDVEMFDLIDRMPMRKAGQS